MHFVNDDQAVLGHLPVVVEKLLEQNAVRHEGDTCGGRRGPLEADVKANLQKNQ